MYKFLIVNEDITGRKDIKRLLQNVGIECEIYETGSSACVTDIINQYGIDVVCIELDLGSEEELLYIENLVRTFEWIKVIVFSVKKDFDILLSALRAGVSDYILTPVNAEELGNVINRITNRVEITKAFNDINTRGMEYVTEHMLYLAVNGTDFNEIEAYNNGVIDMSFLNSFNYMMLLDFNNYFYGAKGNSFKERFVKTAGKDVAYLNLNQQQSVFFFKDTQEDYVVKAEQLIKNIYEIYGEKCFAAVSQRFEGFEGIARAMEEIDTLIEGKFYNEPGTVLVADRCAVLKAEEDMVDVDDDTIMKHMKQDIRLKDVHSLRKHFGKFCKKYRNKTDFSQMYIKFLFAKMLKVFKDNIPETNEAELNEEVEILYKAVDFNTVIEIVNKNIDRLEKVFMENPQMVHKEIEIVKEYIYEHYGEEISVEKLGEMVFMAPSYLSYIFKKDTGQNLSKFIKEFRMEKAKYMLENTTYKIIDISNTCGYPNVSYFCSCFREFFGVSPQKYRENGDDCVQGSV